MERRLANQDEKKYSCTGKVFPDKESVLIAYHFGYVDIHAKN
jgi:hypothetical protein